ncbi:MAG: sigma-70 family RNA polymerase sigma factor [Opitutaceae bacterium]|jgi:RNA polymerase sigma-70 factor (ECF subfamily)
MPSATESDPLPVAQARAGDSAAWDRLLRRYQLPLFAFVHELVRHEATSFDLVQATFVRAVRHIGTLRDDARFGSWLFGIAHQLCVQHWRRSGREQPLGDLLEAAADENVPDPRDLVLRAEQGAALLALVDELPPPQRAVLVLHVLDEFSLDEIAAITGAPLGTVKSRLHHAKRALRQRLQLHPPDALAT